MSQQQPSSHALSGYAAPLFEENKLHRTDDRMIGGGVEKVSSTHHHDKEKALKMLNGLCYDPFFKAEDIDSPKFQNIPDCAAPASSKAAPIFQKIDYRKPLDSTYKKRTYILGTERIQNEKKKHQRFSKRRRRR